MKVVNLQNPINWNHPLNKDLVAWYLTIPEISKGNTWFNLISNFRLNNGTLTNGPVWQGKSERPGGFGSLFFDGSNDSVVVASNSSIPSGSAKRTICCWANQITRAAGSNSGIVQINTSSGQTFLLQTSLVGTTIYLFTDGVNTGNNISLSGGEIPSLNEWNNIIFSFDGSSSWQYYLNGILVKNGTFSNAINTGGTDLRIGNRMGMNSYHGLIDDIRIYSKVLSASESCFLYNESKSGYKNVLNFRRPNNRFKKPFNIGNLSFH